jgi:hypothetical protein
MLLLTLHGYHSVRASEEAEMKKYLEKIVFTGTSQYKPAVNRIL